MAEFGDVLRASESLFARRRWNGNLQSPLCPCRPPRPRENRGEARAIAPTPSQNAKQWALVGRWRGLARRSGALTIGA